MTTLMEPPTSAGGPTTTSDVFRTTTGLAITGTSSGTPMRIIPLAPRTNAGIPIEVAPDAAAALAELRRRAGLTWDQLAELFGVSRRSVHFWASGRPLTAGHLAHLSESLEIVRRLDHGDPGATREALFAPRAGGSSLFACLKTSRYGECRTAIAEAGVVARPILPPAEPADLTARRPLPIDATLASEWMPAHLPSEGRRKVVARRRPSEN